MLSRICKFTFFDLSKEIASVEFTNDEQIKSKSVLDGVIPKLAKTSESVFLQILMIIFIDLDPIIPFITLLIFGIHVLWIYCSPFFKKNHQIGDVV
jgi:AAA family ATP:ADP antiporter